jgi:phospholipase/carboxylesterase
MIHPSINQMKKEGSSIAIILVSFLLLISCSKVEPEISDDVPPNQVEYIALPIRSAPRPETTTGIPHIQIDVEPVPEVHEELIRRIYAIPGIEDRPSVISSWRGLWLSEDVPVVQTEALIDEREFGHIHNDGSLHIFLDSRRAIQAVNTGWAIFHPFALQGLQGWEGFVMLYTPQSMDELDVTFLLIVDGYNNVTGQMLLASDYY